MAVVTSTEAGGTGRYIRYDDAALDDMGAQTIIVYAKPSGSGGGGFGYFYGKTPTGAIGGPRLFVDDNGGTPKITFGAASDGGTGLPTASTTAAGSYPSSWTYYTLTWDGGNAASGIVLYVNNTDTTDGSSRTDGGVIDSDSANPVFLMNRFGLGREVIGDVAWIAVWDRVLNSTERATVTNGTNGPLDVPTNLVLLFANDDDLSANAFTYASRSTRVTGATPTNTALGGSTAAALEFSGNVTVTKTGAALTTSITLASSVNVTVTKTTATLTTPFVIDDNYERSSINVSSSTVVGEGDSAVITLVPRMQESEVVGESRWIEPSARITGVNGFRPTFKFSNYTGTPGANLYHGETWQTGRRPRYSYDGITWTAFDTNVTVGASDITFQNSTAFTGNVVYISRSRQYSVESTGDWLVSLSSSVFVPAASAVAFTPVTTTGFAAQTFIAKDYSTQTDELSRTIPATPLYAAEINDTTLTPRAGGSKRVAVITGGAHAGEDHGDAVMRAVVEALLGSSTAAQSLRREFRILVYPLINAPGRAGGGWRGSFTNGSGGEDDANRHFSDSSPDENTPIQIVGKPRAAITTDLGGATPAWSIDFHGTYLNKWSTFEDVGTPSSITFNDRLAAIAGYTIEDEGTTHAGFISEYFRGLGALPAITHEAGEPTPTTDGEITTHAGYILTALESMVVGAELASSVTATVTKTGAALTTSITLASSVAVVVTSQAGFEPPAPAAFEFSGNVTVTKTGAALTTSKPLLGDLVVRVTSTAPLTGGSIPVTTQGGGVAVPYNPPKKKKKLVKAVVNEEWLKAEETARQLLQSRFKTETVEDKQKVLLDHIESLQPIIEKLKSLSEPVQEKEPVQETRTEPETELKQVLNQVEKLTKKLTSLEELIVVLIASQ